MRIARLLLVAGFALAGCSSGGGDSNNTSTFGISGTVSGAAAAGVTISLGGAATVTTTTDASGGYRFTGLANGTYVVAPSLAGHAFAPASRSVGVNGADVAAQDFTATAVSRTFAVSGMVSGAVTADVTISLGGAATASTTTDADGGYRFTGLADGTYVVTPTLVGYTFAPASRTVSVNGADSSGQDFAATAVTHAVSGVVRGSATAGVTISLIGAATATTTTDASGGYRFSGLADGTYVVTPTLAGHAFAPASRTVAVNGADVGAQDFTATAVSITYAVSGTVSGVVAAGVTISLGGAATATTTTDASGGYQFAGLAGGTYVVTPMLAGYAFAPASRTVAVNGADRSGQDFVATAVTYAISGTVSGSVSAGVTISLGGAATATTTTDAGGVYRFAGLANGTYAVTPILAGHTFAPASRTVAVNGADVAAQDFTATAVSSTHAISGTVSGAVSAGVTLSLGGAATASTTTDASGGYQFAGLANGTYVVTPALAGHRFAPASRTVTVNGADVGGQDFVMTAITYAISGTVSGSATAGVTISLGGAATGTTTTDAAGAYRFTGLANGTYVVTPTLGGHTFAPASRTLAVNGADVGAQDFTATVVLITHAVSGTVSGAVTAGVTVSLGGATTASTTTDASGRYRFAGLANGTYVVTPALAGYTFAPANRIVTVDGRDEVLEPFAAQLARWELVASGTRSVLRAVWGSSPQDIWIVGHGPILHWDGSRITDFGNPAGRSLNAVWGASATDVWAVGDMSIVHWDGSSWTAPSSGSGLDIELRGLWGSSASDIWAIGVDPWHFDGALWSRGAAPLPKYEVSDEMDGIWGSAPDDIWVVGDDVDRFDGSRWGLYVYDCDLHGVWGASRSNVWAVGSAILHYDGRRWGFVPSPIGEPGVTATLRAVWGSSPSDVWAVGGGNVLHWGGSRWDDVQPTVGGAPLWGVWGSSASDVWMVGENGTIVRYH